MSEEAKALDEARWAEAGRQAEWGSPTITKDKRQVSRGMELATQDARHG